MGQKISIREALIITRDRLSNISIPVGLIGIGNQIAECANNLTAVLTALEREVVEDAVQNGDTNGSDEACQGEES